MRVLVFLLIIILAGAGLWWHASRQPPSTPPSAPPGPAVAAPPVKPSAFRKLVFPTDQQALLETPQAGVFQPTDAGNIESALYGSVRTVKSGHGLVASFHEGIDIAPLRRTARGMPMDNVHAVSDGRVGYVNRVPGNSNYGQYVVLLHDDPMGEVYTLYAHLAAVDPALQQGRAVASGAVLGRMGNTPASIIPAGRGHLHFEVGLLLNARFGEWFRAQRLKPDHGAFNGWNLQALNPLEFLRFQHDGTDFTFRRFLDRVPVAFEVMAPVNGPLDYFRRYPSLWDGDAMRPGWVVLACSENGTPLRGRMAAPEEIRQVNGRKPVVLEANAGVLGRNGCHLVQRDGNGGWRIGTKGERWLEILAYP